MQQPVVSTRRVAQLQQQQLVCMASKLEDVPLFADSSAKPQSTSAAVSSSGPKAGPAKLEDIPLNSEVMENDVARKSGVQPQGQRLALAVYNCKPWVEPAVSFACITLFQSVQSTSLVFLCLNDSLQ